MHPHIKPPTVSEGYTFRNNKYISKCFGLALPRRSFKSNFAHRIAQMWGEHPKHERNLLSRTRVRSTGLLISMFVPIIENVSDEGSTIKMLHLHRNFYLCDPDAYNSDLLKQTTSCMVALHLVCKFWCKFWGGGGPAQEGGPAQSNIRFPVLVYTFHCG